MERKRENTEPCISDGESKRQRSSSESSIEEEIITKPSRENVLEKLKKAAPFYFFLNKVEDEPETHDEDLSITFSELLCLSEPGELEHSVHFTMVVEETWLKAQYAAAGIENPKIDVYYEKSQDSDGEVALFPASVNLFFVKPNSLFGHHHTKMSLLFYKDGSARVVICTGNLIRANWENETQGFWISPLLPVMQTAQGESITNFKTDLLNYLNFYEKDSLNPWIERLQKVDMSSVMVCFIASVPGTHTGDEYGYRKLRHMLTEHVENPKPDWHIIAQCSSIGSLGKTPEEWLRGPFGHALSPDCVQLPPFSVIYPTRANVESSLDGIYGGQGLRYEFKLHKSQPWIKEYLRQWKSDGRHRTGAMPHIKTYAQVSPDDQKAGWFLLSSANLAKAAWGMENKPKKKDGSIGLRVLSYEVGILFLPKFLTGKSEFRIRGSGKFCNEDFPFPYDLPLTPYASNDGPFLYNPFMFPSNF